MPSTSAAQHSFMAMADSPSGRAKLKAEGKKLPPKSVAHEFKQADKGKHFKKKSVAHALYGPNEGRMDNG